MAGFLRFVLLASPLLLASPTPRPLSREYNSSIALDGILANIGSNGTLSHGAKAGIVIASPSTASPSFAPFAPALSACPAHKLTPTDQP
jgi:glucoamylase